MPASLEALTFTLAGFMSGQFSSYFVHPTSPNIDFNIAGYHFCGAFFFMPAVQKAPSPLVAQQWKSAWDVGRYVGKVVVTGTAASFAYLAYVEPVKTGNSRFRSFAAVAGIVGAIVPYTIFVSYPFNEAINEQLGAAGSEKMELKKLVVRGRTDWKRSLLAFVGTGVGVCGTLA